MSNENRISGLDGLRGLAALAVLVIHAMANTGTATAFAYVGGHAVAVFFVLSGFLITRILIGIRDNGEGLGGFYVKRTARIMPVYFIAVAFVGMMWGGVGHAIFFAENFTTITSFDSPVAVWHLWSIAVEEHFYLLWPWFVLLCPPRRLFDLCVVGIVCGWLFGWIAPYVFPTADQGELLYKFTLCRVPSLLLGAAIAAADRTILLHSRRAIAVGVLLIAAHFTFGTNGKPTGNISNDLLACGIFLLARYSTTGPLAAALNSRWLVMPGMLSYGLYVYHWPLMRLAHHIEPYSPALTGVAIIASFVVALISFHFMEEPIRRWARAKTRHDHTQHHAAGERQQQADAQPQAPVA